MNNFLHIVNGFAETSLLTEVLDSIDLPHNNHILSIYNLLALGPLLNPSSKENQHYRNEYFRKLDANIGYEHDEDYDSTVYDFLHFDFEKYDKIIVWTGDSTSEVLLKTLACSTVPKDLFEIKVSKYFTDSGLQFFKLLECKPAHVKKMLGKEELISPEEKDHFAKMWSKTIKSPEQLRIIENENLLEVSESYFDQQLMENVTTDWQKIIKATGKSMAMINQLPNYEFTCSRYFSLAKNKKLLLKGNSKEMLEVLIKKN